MEVQQSNMGHSKRSSKKAVYSNISLPQETRKISNEHVTLHLKEQEREQKIPQLVDGKK